MWNTWNIFKPNSIDQRLKAADNQRREANGYYYARSKNLNIDLFLFHNMNEEENTNTN